MLNRNIAIDKDDTLNYLTLDICKSAGLSHIPTLDVIKSGRASKEYYAARAAFFAEPKNFANAPYGLGKNIVSKAQDHGFNPVICTKTMSDHPRGDEIVAHKFKFLREHFSGIEAMIVMGRKFPDAAGMIDDSLSNCLFFNSSRNRPFLTWNHKTGSILALDSFYQYANDFVEVVNNQVLNFNDKESYILVYDTSCDVPCFYLRKAVDNDKEESVFVGAYLLTHALNKRFIDVYASKELWELDTAVRKELYADMANPECTTPQESSAMLNVLAYNVESAIYS
ncbi:hypothetical protein LMH73_013880 [Vibrio splendidus]|nr:hypothetical protein [Vibrio splendidus]MCC4883059.1 hypothetical protein [Vibrio splendidus]